MSAITLQEKDLCLVRFSWSSMVQRSPQGHNRFMNKLFANMIIANPKLQNIFNNEIVVREQAKLFGEMISFTMAYLDDQLMLTECMSQFFKENPSVINLGIQYIEPLGISLIQTFHQTLGKGQFPPQVEGVWIKVYLYLANALLQSECEKEIECDAKSIMSIELAELSDEEEVEMTKRNNNSTSIRNGLCGPVKVKFQLSSNEKYKGFRRSVNEAPDVELEAIIPQITLPKNISIPTRARNNTPIHTPRSLVSSSPSPPSSISINSGNYDPRKIRKNSKQPTREDYGIPEKNPRRSMPYTIENNDQPPRRKLFDCKELPTPPLEMVDTKFDLDIQEDLSTYEDDEFDEDEQIIATAVSKPMEQPIVNSDRDFRRLQFKKPIPQFVDSESDEEAVTPIAPFDPRGRKRTPQSLYASPIESEVEQDAESVYSTTEPLFAKPNVSFSNSKKTPRVISSTSPRTVLSSLNDVDDETLMQELLQMTNPIPMQKVQPQSPQLRPYGKGLAPIREMEFDDDASSKYDSDDTISNKSERSSSHDEVSSGVSTLSLHNSDYRSSISSENSSPNFSPLQTKPIQQQQFHSSRSLSQSSEISYMKSLDIPEPRTTYVKKPINCKVSAGFLRSSFVLQNMAQNNYKSGLTAPVQSVSSLAPAPISTSEIVDFTPTVKKQDVTKKDATLMPLAIKEDIEVGNLMGAKKVEYVSDSDDDCLDLLNLFVPVSSPKKTEVKKSTNTPPKTIRPSRSSSSLQRNSMSLPRSSSTLRSSVSLPRASLSSQRNTVVPEALVVLACDKNQKRGFMERIGLSRSGSRSSSRLNSLSSVTTMTMSNTATNNKLTSDLYSVQSNDSIDSTFSGFSFFSGAQKNTNTGVRRNLMDTRRKLFDTRGPKVPVGSKYNKIKSGRFSFFGSAF